MSLTKPTIHGQMLEEVTSWVQPIERNISHWTFQFSGRPDRTVAYVVHRLHTISDHQFHAYVVEVPGATARAWPLSNLDYQQRDRNELVSDAVFTERFIEMYRELAARALQALILAPPQQS